MGMKVDPTELDFKKLLQDVVNQNDAARERLAIERAKNKFRQSLVGFELQFTKIDKKKGQLCEVRLIQTTPKARYSNVALKRCPLPVAQFLTRLTPAQCEQICQRRHDSGAWTFRVKPEALANARIDESGKVVL